MKKFVFLYHSFQEPSADVMDAWGTWFAAVGDKFIDSGNPFGEGREVTKTGSRSLTSDLRPASGYSILNADSIDEAEKLLEGCPAIDSVRIYEAMPM